MKKDNFYITKEETPEGLRFIINGRVDSVNSPALQCELDKAVKDGVKRIVLYMYKVKFLSSAGIRMILITHRNITKAGGTFGIERPSENVKNVLGMAALDELLV